MGFGAIITIGENNTPLDEDLAGCIAEVRIEQKLDQPTQFAVRFLDDIEDGRLRSADERLAIDTIMSVIVETGEAMSASPGSSSKPTCLVRGPIVQDRSEMMIGGPGSWFEIHGLDRRDLLDRLCVPAARGGRASDAAREILDRVFDVLDVEDTTRVYDERRETLNDRDTDLEFLTRIAKRNNLNFWITYDCTRSPIGSGYKVTETAHLASSPRRPEGGVSGAIASAIQLIPTNDLTLRIHVPAKECPNVTAFQVSVDGDRPSRYRAGSMPTEEIRPGATQAFDPQPPAGQGGQRLGQLGGVMRELCLPGSGDPQDTQTRGEAALTAAGWFVQATASTTRHLLGGVLRPHDVIAAMGVGPRFGRSVAFRVKEVTHVINAAEHFMDLRLESNSIGKA